MSAAGRKRTAAAQKARRADKKAAEKEQAAKVGKSPKAKTTQRGLHLQKTNRVITAESPKKMVAGVAISAENERSAK